MDGASFFSSRSELVLPGALQGEENRQRFGITDRFQLFPTVTHCTKGIAVALCLLYLWVFSISLNQEPL